MTQIVKLLLSKFEQDRRLLLDSGFTLAANLAGVGLIFALQVLLARTLGEEPYSQFAYAISILTVLTTLGVFGLDVATQRFVPTALEQGDAAAHKGFLRRSLQMTLLIAGILGAVLAIASVALDGVISENLQLLLQIVALGIPGGSLLLLLSAYARALARPVLAVLPRLVIKPFAMIALVMTFGLLQWEMSMHDIFFWEIAVAVVIAVLLGWLLLAGVKPILGDTEPRYETRRWLSVSSPLFLNSGFQVLIRQADIIILGAIIGTTQVAHYAVATKVAALAAFGLVAINAVLPPLIVRHMVRNEITEARRIAAVSSLAMVSFSAAVSLLLWQFSGPLLSIFGQDYVEARPLLYILIAGQLINALTGSVSYLLAVSGEERILVRVVAGALVLNVMLCFLLIPRFGALGAAIGVTTATAASNLILLMLCRSRTGIDPSFYGAMKTLGAK